MPYDVDAELLHEAARADKYGYSNYGFAYFVALLAVVGSVVGAGLAAFEANKILTASVALVPALVAAFTRVFSFEQKALWHWGKAHSFKAIRRSLGVGALTTVQAAEAMNEVSKTQYQGWVKLDPLVVTAKSSDGT